MLHQNHPSTHFGQKPARPRSGVNEDPMGAPVHQRQVLGRIPMGSMGKLVSCVNSAWKATVNKSMSHTKRECSLYVLQAKPFPLRQFHVLKQACRLNKTKLSF